MSILEYWPLSIGYCQESLDATPVVNRLSTDQRDVRLRFALGQVALRDSVGCMRHPADARRRWFGMFFLLMAGGMLIWGQTVLRPHLGEGLLFLVYWLVCFGFTGLAILTALLDFWIVRLRSRQEQRTLAEKSFPVLKSAKHPAPSENSGQKEKDAS